MNNSPQVTVLMPAYNAEKYIGEAIESILSQTFRDFEFIIIDDCSVDRTGSIIKEYAKKDERIIALRNDSNLKICKTLNKGIALAKGKYIARMDADDWSYPDRLEKQFRFMEKSTAVGVSGGAMEVCDEEMKTLSIRRYRLSDKEIRRKMFLYNPFSHPLTIWRTNAFREVGGYNEELFDAEDYELYFRLGRILQFGNLPDVLMKYRISKASVSSQRARRQEKLVLYIKLKASMEFHYKMTTMDKVYLAGHFLSMYLIPTKLKICLFNLLRNSR